MDTVVLEKVKKILETALTKAKHGDVLDALKKVRIITEGVAEPDYIPPRSGIVVLGEWGPYVKEVEGKEMVADKTCVIAASKILKAGGDVEPIEGWMICGKCSKIVRNKVLPYAWVHDLIEVEDEAPKSITCGDCVKLDPKPYLEAISGTYEKPMGITGLDVSKHDYQCLQPGFQRGAGKSHSPKNIANALKKQGISKFIFVIDEDYPDHCKFSVWVHVSQIGAVDLEQFSKDAKDVREGSSSADINAMIKGLLGGSPKAKKKGSAPFTPDDIEKIGEEITKALTEAMKQPGHHNHGVIAIEIDHEGKATHKLETSKESKEEAIEKLKKLIKKMKDE